MAGMSAGQCSANAVTGAAGRAWTIFAANPNAGVVAAALTVGSTQQLMLSALIEAIVLGVIAEIQANAVVTVTIGAGVGGLQKSTAVGSLTASSGATVTLPGTVA